MELPDTRQIHAMLYNDEMDVYRVGDGEPNEYGIVGHERKKVMDRVKCKLSLYTLSREDNPGDDSGYYRKVNSIIKIFCDPSLVFKPGDWIDVYRKRRGSDEFELFFQGLCNKPNIHGSHQEVEVAEREVN